MLGQVQSVSWVPYGLPLLLSPSHTLPFPLLGLLTLLGGFPFVIGCCRGPPLLLPPKPILPPFGPLTPKR
ncbi:unnamed protein product [Staurois parvus]|uniref:Uncharacterized protein n=1 Tax=Staurois parvus TaxID=386267 RepID=A0ABN9EY61_9NEOB|nr:unnamed protein product [Staurois parvus]